MGEDHPALGGLLLKVVRRCPTLPQGPPCSTIGAEGLSFRVRNVTGRFPFAMAAETLLICVVCGQLFGPFDVAQGPSVERGSPTVNREPQSGREQLQQFKRMCVVKLSAY